LHFGSSNLATVLELFALSVVGTSKDGGRDMKAGKRRSCVGMTGLADHEMNACASNRCVTFKNGRKLKTNSLSLGTLWMSLWGS
jgi:hypothetical protein